MCVCDVLFVHVLTNKAMEWFASVESFKFPVSLRSFKLVFRPVDILSGSQ